MAVSESNLLSTPEGYATPQQLAQMRDYAKALMAPTPIRPLAHWMPAVADAVSGLTGGYLQHRAGERELQSMDYAGGQKVEGLTGTPAPGQPPVPPAAAGGSPTGAPTGAPTPGGQDPATIRFNNPGGQYPGPSARAYGTTGTATIGGGHQIAQFPDPVSGAAAQFDLLKRGYAGMPLDQALAKWSGGNNAATYLAGVTRATGLPPNTPITPELLASPQGIALVQAMARHETGRDYPMSPQQWAEAQSKVFGGGAGGAPDSPQAMAAAARGAPAGAAPSGPAGTPRTIGSIPLTSQVNLPPGIVQPRVAPNPQALRFLLGAGSGYTSEAQQNLMTNMYLDRNKPQEFAAPGGRIITSDGKTGTFVPEIIKRDGAKGVEGMQNAPTSEAIDPNTGTYRVLNDGTMGFGPTGIPSPPGMGGTRGSPSAPPPMLDIPSIGPSTPAPGAGPRSEAPAPEGAPQTAALEEPAPEQAIAQATEQPPSLLNVKPPLMDTNPGSIAGQAQQNGIPTPAGVEAPQPVPEAAPPVEPAPADAQAQSVISPRDQAFFDQSMQMGRDYSANKHYDTKNIDAAEKAYEKIVDTGASASKLKEQLDVAKMLVNNPGLIQGVGAGARLDWARITGLLGNVDNAKRAAITQAFEKVVSGSILNEMRTALQGLGQVRVAEIDLLNRSSPSMYNQPGANAAIIDLQSRVADMAIDARRAATAFRQGVRWDAQGNPIKDANGRPVLHSGRPSREELDATIQRLMDNHPRKMNDQDRQNYLGLINSTEEAAHPAAPSASRGRGLPSAPRPAAPPPAANIPPPPEGFQ